jgi:hypothetical protein
MNKIQQQSTIIVLSAPVSIAALPQQPFILPKKILTCMHVQGLLFKFFFFQFQ